MNDSSNVNTILLVILIALVVGGLVWFFTSRSIPAPAQKPGDLKVDVTLPDMQKDTSGDTKDQTQP